MTDLFRIFDPSTSESLSLNWFILVVILLFLPKLLHLSPGRYGSGHRDLIGFLHSDFSMAMGVSPIQGLTPFLLSTFTLILRMNFLGLMPYNFTCSRNLGVTLGISLFV